MPGTSWGSSDYQQEPNSMIRIFTSVAMNVEPRNPPVAAQHLHQPGASARLLLASRDCNRHIHSTHPARSSGVVSSSNVPRRSRPEMQKKAIVILHVKGSAETSPL